MLLQEVPSGSAGSTLPTRKRQLLARESLSSTDAPMAELDDEYVEVEVEEETVDVIEGEVPQPRTPPATHMTLEDAAANVPEPENPFVMTGPSIFPCPTCQAECFVGQHHCIRRRRLAESKGEDRRFIQAAHRRNRILDRLATVGVSVNNISPYELQKLARRTKEEEEEGGQMSYEAQTIRKAKDKVQRALKIRGMNFRSLVDRFDNDPTYAARQAENGLTRADIRRLQVLLARAWSYPPTGHPRSWKSC